jgi:hypothetical protein
MYDPTTGRFLTEDPSDYLGGDTNLYRYAKNSPTNANDPTGLSPQSPQQLTQLEQQVCAGGCNGGAGNEGATGILSGLAMMVSAVSPMIAAAEQQIAEVDMQGAVESEMQTAAENVVQVVEEAPPRLLGEQGEMQHVAK